jgi:hypothetical protein
MILSNEQQSILDNVLAEKNIIVDAVAGTGKTTIILAIADKIKDKQILQMTYNSSLRLDVKAKVDEMKLENIRVHTFHSLAVRYYDPNSFTDTELRRIVLNNTHPISTINRFDILVLDECQDMSFLYFQFIIKFIKDMGSSIQLLIMGDYMQGLYDFKGADTRFLVLADILWNDFRLLRTSGFVKCTMQMSFRITNQICSFVNDVMLGTPRMKACRDDQNVRYIRNSRYNIQNIVCAEIYKLFEKGVKPNEIFILGSSVRGINSNIRKLENSLVQKNIPCHVPFLENDSIDDRVIDKKVVFSTFHCVKGRQRPYVFIVSFDNSYYRFYARNKSIDDCPNTLYVAATRAMKGLYLLENNQYREDRPLKFLKKTHIEMKNSNYIDFYGMQQTNFVEEEDTQSSNGMKTQQKHYLTPTELIKFIPESVIEEIIPIIDKILLEEKNDLDEIDIPSIIETKMGYFEEVSHLNGIAIPCMYYDYLVQKSSTESNKKSNILFDIIHSNIQKMKNHEHIFLKKIVETIPETIEKIEDYLYLANICSAIQEKLYFKLAQIDIDEYKWLNDDTTTKCKERLDTIIGSDCSLSKPYIEETIINENDELHVRIDRFLEQYFGLNKLFRFNARIDMRTDNTIWELKCTSKISIEHKLQLVIYAWLWKMRSDIDIERENAEEKQFKLFNIKTGHIYRLNTDMEDLNKIIVALLKGRYMEEPLKTDEEFIRDCRTYIENI